MGMWRSAGGICGRLPGKPKRSNVAANTAINRSAASSPNALDRPNTLLLRAISSGIGSLSKAYWYGNVEDLSNSDHRVPSEEFQGAVSVCDGSNTKPYWEG